MDFKAYGFYETAGKEQFTGATGIPGYTTPAASRAAFAATGTNTVQTLRYDALSFYKAGVAVTAANVTLAADYIGGAINGQLNMRPTGAVAMNAIVTGLTYANGPITLGAEFGLVESQGDARLTGVSQRHEYEAAFGGSYKLAPGVQLVGEYMYMYRHQGGFDFSNGNLGVGGVTRDAQAQSAVFSTVLTW